MRASPEKIETATKVMLKMAAYDPFFRNATPAVVTAWAEALTLANVPEDIALEGVARMYAHVDNPNFRPLPGMLINVCRQLRQEKSERRRDDEERREELAGPPKMTLREWERATGKKFPRVSVGRSVDAALGSAPPVDPYAAIPINPLRVECPHCKVMPGSRCVTPGTLQPLQRRAHPSRYDAYSRRAACPECGADVRRPCVIPGSQDVAAVPHMSRFEAAERADV